MFDDSRSFIGRPFPQSTLNYEFADSLEAGRDADVLERLKKWHGRAKLSEVQAESAFIQTFFVELWGYSAICSAMKWCSHGGDWSPT